MRVSGIRQLCVWVVSIFAITVVGQGGQYGFPPSPACSAGQTTYGKWRNLGCYNLGVDSASTLTDIGTDATNSISRRGGGQFYYSFALSATNTGGMTFPGYIDGE